MVAWIGEIAAPSGARAYTSPVSQHFCIEKTAGYSENEAGHASHLQKGHERPQHKWRVEYMPGDVVSSGGQGVASRQAKRRDRSV